MFASKRAPEEPEAVMNEEPETPLTAREKPPASESKLFTEGATFAERKAEADARNQARATRRLVRLGDSEFWQRDRHGNTEAVAVELFADVDKPADRYVKFPGNDRLVPLHDDQREDAVTKLPPLKTDPRRGFGQPKSLRDPSPLDPPPRPI